MAGGKAAPAASSEPEPPAIWSRSDDKLLEMLLVYNLPRWDLIASRLPGNKTPEQAAQRYERMVHEVTHALTALHVETPRQWDDVVVAADQAPADGEEALAAASGPEAVPEKALAVPTPSAAAGEASEGVATMRKGRRERKKPVAWTEEEHNLFLEGLEKYGKGKWKLMSSEFLTTKSASQIASHHQKHRNRLEQRKRNACKRASIHDITQPTSTAVVVVAEPAGAALKDDQRRVDDQEAKAPGKGQQRGTADQGGEPGDQLVGALEEFPGEDDPGTLFI